MTVKPQPPKKIDPTDTIPQDPRRIIAVDEKIVLKPNAVLGRK